MTGHDFPTCGKTLSTEQGMRQHHTKVHGDYLPNPTCDDCEETFYDPKARRTYCEDCYTETGEQNGNWKDAKESADCRKCGKTFEYYPSDKEGVFCSECVQRMDEFYGTPSYEGTLTEAVTTPCGQCESPVTVRESKRAYGAGRFCSRNCLAEWQSENWRGKNHPGWNDERVKNWSEARQRR